jgi:cysteinyl-tRNA synthetase
MAITKLEMELTNSLLTLQRQYNELHDYKEELIKLARERLIDIEHLQKDVRSLINEIEESSVEARPAAMPMNVLSSRTVSVILFGR